MDAVQVEWLEKENKTQEVRINEKGTEAGEIEEGRTEAGGIEEGRTEAGEIEESRTEAEEIEKSRTEQGDFLGNRLIPLREGSKSYLIELCDSEFDDEEAMLADNMVDCLLPMTIKYRNGQACRYYDVTGRQPLSGCYDKKEITYEELRTMLICTGSCLERMGEYLLSEDKLLFEPAYVYAGIDSRQLRFLYVPSLKGTFAEHIRGLAGFLMERVDFQDERAVALSCQFCKYTEAENFNMDVFLEENRQYLTVGENPEEEQPDEETRNISAKREPAETDTSATAAERKPEEGPKQSAVICLAIAAAVVIAVRAFGGNEPVLAVAGGCAGIGAFALYRYLKWARRTLEKKEREIYRL